MARRRASRPASKRSKASQPPLRWFKGNTHTHTTRSDGDSPPGRVARWYRDHNYDFLVLSDHARRVPIDTVQAAITRENKARKRKPFLLIPGEEANAMVGSGGMLRMAHAFAYQANPTTKSARRPMAPV